MPPNAPSVPPRGADAPELREATAALRGELIRAAGFGLCASLLALTPSWYMLEVYDRVVNSRNGTTLAMLTIAVLLAYLLVQVQEWSREGLLRAAAIGFERRLGQRVFAAALAASRRAPGSGMQAVQDLRTLREFIPSPVVVAVFEAPMVIVFLALVSAMSPWLGLVTLLAALLQAGIGALNESTTGGALREANRQGWGAQAYAERLMQNAPAIQSMGMLGAVHKRWLERHGKALALQAEASRAAGGWQALSKLLQNVVSSGLLGLSAWLLLHDQLAGGGAMLVVAGIFGGRALAPFIQIVTHWQSVVNAREAWVRLHALLGSQPAAAPAMPLPPPKGQLSVIQAGVAAPGPGGAALLNGIHFSLQPGEVLAVIGPSGSGKTVLARMLLGLWPATSGKVRLDGVDLAGWSKAEVGPHLGYLPQGVDLLDGTLADNVARFGPYDEARMHAAIEAAGLYELVQSLPDGLDTPLGPNGATLSGGQRQRVGLARAIYASPALVVLDEPNASLDEAGDLALAQLIDSRKRAGTTFVVITHRSSILATADKLLVLFEGQQQAFGPRDEVLAAIRQANQQAAQNAAQQAAQQAARPPAPRPVHAEAAIA